MCVSETGSQQKRFDLEPTYSVSLATKRYKLERGAVCGCQPWHRLQVRTTAYWMTVLKTGQHWTLTFRELQLAKRRDSREVIG